MSSRRIRFVVPAVLVLSLGLASFAIAASLDHDHGKKVGWGKNRTTFTAKLNGHQETPATIHTAATGHLMLTMTNSTTFSYELTYSGLSGNAAAAHIHFGAPGTSGGVIVDLCGGTKPACPAGTSATVTGTFAAADVKALAAQGFTAGDFNGFVDELKQGFMYGNVHTAAFGSGEIRGQLNGKNGKHDDDDD